MAHSLPYRKVKHNALYAVLRMWRTNFMTNPQQSETPRTDKLIYGMNKELTVELVNADFARTLERELNQAKRRELENTKGTEAIWNAVQKLSPWCESNDMEWADEILC